MKRLTELGRVLVCAAALSAWLVMPGQAAPPRETAATGPIGNPDRGRAIFNGIGGCYNCHGVDAFIKKRPKPTPQIREDLKRMKPPPTDLRDPASWKSRSETDRLLTLRKGHEGTAMFAKKFLTDREMADILEYLAALRKEATKKPGARP